MFAPPLNRNSNRKKISLKYFLLGLVILTATNTYAQVGIGTNTPAASAALEVTSSTNNKGILIPRITATQKDAISNPAEGLMVYQTSAPAGFYFYTGSAWKLMVTQTDLDAKLSTADATLSLNTKVDKVAGKELSSNDYTTTEKTKLAAITGSNTGDQDLSAIATITSVALKANTTDVATGLASKVDKVTGKDLSSNDYTTAEKTKLAAITGSNTGDQDLSTLATTASVALKANITDVNTSLALKANTAEVTNSLALKANITDVNTALALKANTAEVNNSLALKAPLASPTLVTPNIGVATGTSLSVSGQLTSTIAIGAAPLVVSSTTPVANLSIGGNAATATLASTVTTNANLTGDVISSGSNVTTIDAGKVTNAMLAGSIDLTSKVTGTLPIANGGTGSTTGSITGTGALTFTAGGTNTDVTITPNGTGNTVLNGDAVVGTSTPNASAVLEAASTTKGFLPPRMTQAQRIAIVSPAAGLIVWCTDCSTAGELQVNNGTTWTNMVGGTASGIIPDAPTSPVATAGNAHVSIAFTAPASTGGSAITGYTVTSTSGGFTATGASSPLLVTGLTNGTAYTFTVVATNAAGNSVASAPSAAVKPSLVTSVVLVAPGVAKQFLSHNLGADTSLDPNTPVVGLQGAYIQWGLRGPNTTGDARVDWQTAANTENFAAAPKSGSANDAAISNWSTSSADNGSWGATKIIANDPCPTGYRVPTNAEWTGVNSNNTASRTGAFSNGSTNYGAALHYGPNASTKLLTLPAGGFRGDANGTLYGRGGNGYYWSSTENGISSFGLKFVSSTIDTASSFSRTVGYSLRCIAE